MWHSRINYSRTPCGPSSVQLTVVANFWKGFGVSVATDVRHVRCVSHVVNSLSTVRMSTCVLGSRAILTTQHRRPRVLAIPVMG
jgi:hypothetical protein